MGSSNSNSEPSSSLPPSPNSNSATQTRLLPCRLFGFLNYPRAGRRRSSSERGPANSSIKTGGVKKPSFSGQCANAGAAPPARAALSCRPFTPPARAALSRRPLAPPARAAHSRAAAPYAASTPLSRCTPRRLLAPPARTVPSRRLLAPPSRAALSLPTSLPLLTGKHRTPPHAERVERCLRAGPPRGDKQVRLPTWSPGGK